TIAFWLLGGFHWLDTLVRRADLGAVATALLFIGILLLAPAALDPPSARWATFVIEGRFGFNPTSPPPFWAGRARGRALAALLGGPLLAAVQWLFSTAGPSAWVWCWGVSAAALVVFQIVAPTWILPRFNRFAPLAEGPLREAILGYARRE